MNYVLLEGTCFKPLLTAAFRGRFARFSAGWVALRGPASQNCTAITRVLHVSLSPLYKLPESNSHSSAWGLVGRWCFFHGFLWMCSYSCPKMPSGQLLRLKPSTSHISVPGFLRRGRERLIGYKYALGIG